MKQILATLIFFTRIPFWKIAEVPKEYYERVVPYWPLVGWLTGGVMTVVTMLSGMLSVPIAILMALIARVFITGALHEDGFADFCDGFGGGTTRQRTLEIMKDSHIGTYGVLGLILYYITIFTTLTTLAADYCEALSILPILVVGDTFCKWVSSTIIYFLPYARKEEEAKNKLVYASVTVPQKIVSVTLGIIPLAAYIILCPGAMAVTLASCSAAIICAASLFRFMHSRLQGYTGDCCGATFIATELSFYLAYLILSRMTMLDVAAFAPIL